MSWKEQYERWNNTSNLDEELRQQLTNMSENEKLLEECFYKNLEFGTGGMRGEIGVGTNRMNMYTVRKASEGLAQYILSFGEEAKKRGVAIAYDSRHKSPEFAMESAKTLATHGIQAYVFEELRPTPELSFAVRYLNTFSGIVITASHNPSEYNGYKVYGEDGGQLPPAAADTVIDYVNAVNNELSLVVKSEVELKEAGLIQMIGEEMDTAYTEKLKTISLNKNLANEVSVNVVFTPLHGTGNKPVIAGISAFGYKNVSVVKEQQLPDPNFSTVKSPNPEEKAAFTLAIQEGKEKNADLLIATDPDADRLGIAVKDETGEYVVLTGNQIGAILMQYVLSQKQAQGILPSNSIVFKTIVTSEFGRAVAEDFSVHTEDVLTGFKFIGEKIGAYKQSGEYTFQFGYEESYGYLIGDFVREKDAVQAAVLAVEVCAYYKKQGLSMYDGLLDLYKKYGYFREGLESITLKGKDGAEQIQELLRSFRNNPPKEMAGQAVVTIEDYENSLRINRNAQETIYLPQSNVLKYFLADGSWFCLRPSGTEPKAKVYFGVKGTSLEGSKEQLNTLSTSVMEHVHSILAN